MTSKRHEKEKQRMTTIAFSGYIKRHPRITLGLSPNRPSLKPAFAYRHGTDFLSFRCLFLSAPGPEWTLRVTPGSNNSRNVRTGN